MVSSRKKESYALHTGEQDFLGLLIRLEEVLDSSLTGVGLEVLHRLTKLLAVQSSIEHAAIFLESRDIQGSECQEARHSKKLICLEGVSDLSGSLQKLELKRSSRFAKRLVDGEAIDTSEITRDFAGQIEALFPDQSGELLLFPVVEHQNLKGLILLQLQSQFSDKDEPYDNLLKFLKLLSATLLNRVRRSSGGEFGEFQEWLFDQFSYPVFLIDTRTKRIVRANKAVEQALSAEDSVSPANLVALVESTVEKVGSRNPLVWCKAYLPNLYGDFYIVCTSFSVESPEHVCAALLPSNDKRWDFVRLLKKLAVGDLAAEASVKQLYWDRLVQQVATRLHSSLDLNIVLQLLVDNLGQCLNASRCLFVKSEPTSMVVSHEYSDPSISPLGLGRTSGFPESVISLFRAGPLSLSDVTALRHGSTISGADVSSMLNAGINSLAGAPLVCRGVMFGVLIIIQEGDNREWTSNEMELIRVAARHAAGAIELCLEHQKVKDQLYHASTFRNVDNRQDVEKASSSPVRSQKIDAKVDAPHLSKRELEVLRLIASGLSNKEIAGRLFLTASTVELHASRMRKKLKMKSRTQLVKYACDHGLV